MRVDLTADAREDLTLIEEFIAADDYRRARSFVAELTVRIRQLGRSPRAFPLMDRYGELGIRRRPFRDYLIFYRIVGRRVVVLRVIHGARDYDRIFNSGE